MAHLKRYAMPKDWPVARKTETWIVKPRPGPHSMAGSIPLQLILRDMLHVANSAKEARAILNSGAILIDKKVRKDPKFPVGLMNIIEIPTSKQYFRVTVGKNGMKLEKIPGNDAAIKLCRINGKRKMKGGHEQLNLHDGRNIIAGKKSPYRAGDSVAIELPGQKIIRHYPLERGTEAFICAGRNCGAEGKIKGLNPRKGMLEKSTAVIESGGKDIETLIGYIFPGSFRQSRREAHKAEHKTGPKAIAAKTKPKDIAKPSAKKGKRGSK